ncbi:MAG TPA: TetR/AcrR family transcriptional regulator [Thermoanaerobacterales bacterium]|nr:TetR/AcrR family transcriptional regulator [Thermoanaerobacterales bacterium]
MASNEKGDKKTMLLDAAAEIFSRDGYHKAKVGDIAKHAGVGKGTVYEYFVSKKELFQEVVRSSLGEYEEWIKLEVGSVEKWDEKLKKMVEANIEFALNYRNLARIVSGDPGGIGESTKRWLINERNSMKKFVEHIILNGTRDKIFRPVDPDITSHIVLGALGAVIGKILFDDETDEHEGVKNKLMDILMYGVNLDK